MNEKPLILAVDDEPSNLKLIAASLESDYKVALAKSAALAEQFLKKKMPDLILLDIKMPEKDGLTFAQELMENNPGFSVPIVFITGLSESEAREAAMKLGARGFAEKPLSVTALKKLVNSIFNAEE